VPRKTGRRRRVAPRTTEKSSFGVDDPDAPAVGSDAGQVAAPDGQYGRTMARTRRSAARRHFGNAERLVGHDRPQAEIEARRAIDSIVRAFWWAEDTDLEEAQHQEMHRMGRWTCSTFGCELHFADGRYELRCPIAVAHKRVGFSPGFTALRLCSICAEDLSECPHLRGRLYWVRGGPSRLGMCRVCVEESCTRHDADRLYKASPASVVTEMEALEVSLVRKPANPEARLLALPVDVASLSRGLGPDFKVGMPVSCEKCLQACGGFDQVDVEHRDGPVGTVVDTHMNDEGDADLNIGIG
jgi:hypothetical protein